MKPTVSAPSFAAAGAAASADAEPAGADPGEDLLHDKAESESAPDNKRRERREARIVVMAASV
jgi:hypothetical protein